MEELLTVLNLKDRRNHLPSQLSGGQQQRFEEKLRGLGGIIEKVSDEKEIQKFKLKVG